MTEEMKYDDIPSDMFTTKDDVLKHIFLKILDFKAESYIFKVLEHNNIDEIEDIMVIPKEEVLLLVYYKEPEKLNKKPKSHSERRCI